MTKKVAILNLTLALLLAVAFSASSVVQAATGPLSRPAAQATATPACLPVIPVPEVVNPQAGEFSNSSFQRVWERTDRLVASGSVQRSYFWGPTPGAIVFEQFGCGTGRVVQYFDKSRMEINSAAEPNSQFAVTNGLLTTELVTGRIQVGVNSFEASQPANIPLASDTDDATAPTYASFSKLTGRAQNRVGEQVTMYVDRSGNAYEPKTYQLQLLMTVTTYISETGHNIPEPIWNFLNQQGQILSGTQTITAPLSNPWFYASGYPITEPYWAQVKIAGQQTLVLMQLFERRVVTYVPSEKAAYRVQMGNIGQHYYDWRYKGAGRSSTPATTPTSRPATSATATSVAGGPPAATPAIGPRPTDPPAPTSGYVDGNIPLTAEVAKPTLRKGEVQTISGKTEPEAHVYLLCSTPSGFPSEACPNADSIGATADSSGNYALTWTLSVDSRSHGLIYVLVRANKQATGQRAIYKTSFTVAPLASY